MIANTSRDRPGTKWLARLFARLHAKLFTRIVRERMPSRLWVIVNDAPPDFAVIHRRTNTLVAACTISPRIGSSVVDHLMTKWLSRHRANIQEAERKGTRGREAGNTEVAVEEEEEEEDRIRLDADVSGNFFLLRARDKKEEKERRRAERDSLG